MFDDIPAARKIDSAAFYGFQLLPHRRKLKQKLVIEDLLALKIEGMVRIDLDLVQFIHMGDVESA